MSAASGLLVPNHGIKLVSPSLSTVSSSASLFSHSSPPSPSVANQDALSFVDWNEVKKKKSTFITAVYRNEHKKVKTMLEESEKETHLKQALLGNYVYDFGTITPLFLSCFLGFESCTEILIRHGASVHSKFYSPDQVAKEETSLQQKSNLMETLSPTSSNKASQVVGKAVNLLKNFFVKNDLQAQQQFSASHKISTSSSQKTYVPYIATAIHAACSKNNHSERNVVLLLRHGAEVNCIDNLGETPLFYACRHGQEKSITLLLLAGAKKEFKNFDSQTVLDVLSQNKQTEFIDLVKKFEYTAEKDPILKWKIENQKRETVRLASKQFLDRRKSMRNPSFLSTMTSPFRSATSAPPQPQQQQPLTSPRKSQKEESVSQLTAELLEACKLRYESDEHMERIKYILQKMEDVNRIKDENGDSPLHLFATFHPVVPMDILEAFVEAKFDLNITNSSCKTVMQVLLSRYDGDFSDQVLYLLQHRSSFSKEYVSKFIDEAGSLFINEFEAENFNRKKLDLLCGRLIAEYDLGKVMEHFNFDYIDYLQTHHSTEEEQMDVEMFLVVRIRILFELVTKLSKKIIQYSDPKQHENATQKLIEELAIECNLLANRKDAKIASQQGSMAMDAHALQLYHKISNLKANETVCYFSGCGGGNHVLGLYLNFSIKNDTHVFVRIDNLTQEALHFHTKTLIHEQEFYVPYIFELPKNQLRDYLKKVVKAQFSSNMKQVLADIYSSQFASLFDAGYLAFVGKPTSLYFSICKNFSIGAKYRLHLQTFEKHALYYFVRNYEMKHIPSRYITLALQYKSDGFDSSLYEDTLLIARRDFGFKPFHFEVLQKNIEAVKLMIQKDRLPLKSVTKSLYTSLHFATLNEDVEMAEFLISSFKKNNLLYIIHAKTQSGFTALDFALKLQHSALTKLLYQSEVEISQQVSLQHLSKLVSIFENQDENENAILFNGEAQQLQQEDYEQEEKYTKSKLKRTGSSIQMDLNQTKRVLEEEARQDSFISKGFATPMQQPELFTTEPKPLIDNTKQWQALQNSNTPKHIVQFLESHVTENKSLKAALEHKSKALERMERMVAEKDKQIVELKQQLEQLRNAK